jgi:hypothetical protein
VNASTVLLFGGSSIISFLGDWYLGALPATLTLPMTQTQVPQLPQLQWTQVFPVTPQGPIAPRSGHVMLSPPGSGVFYVHGGTNIDAVQSDLWAFNLTDNTLRLLDPCNATAAAGGACMGQRLQHAGVVDPRDGSLVLIGGSDGDGNDHADVWRWQPATGAWTQLANDSTAQGPAVRQ